MEKKFIRVRSIKDIIIFVSLIIAGCIFAALPNTVGINMGGYTLIVTGFVLAFVLRNVYKDVETGEKYLRKELLFKQEMKDEILSVLDSAPESIKLTEEGKGQVIKLDIYYGKSSGKAYLQLFEYVPHQYKPCSEIYEYETNKLEKLLK